MLVINNIDRWRKIEKNKKIFKKIFCFEKFLHIKYENVINKNSKNLLCKSYNKVFLVFKTRINTKCSALTRAGMSEYGGTGHVYKPCYLDATRQVIVERPVLQIPSCTPEIINRVYESADIKTITEDRIKNAKSDAGNINIENGFELYEKCVFGKLSDRYINVRESGEPTVQIAILDEDEMKAAKGKNNNNEIDMIELFKRNVVAVPLHYLDGSNEREYGTGIFRDVKIFSLNDTINPDGDKKICIDSEYGFRILDV